MYLCGMRMSCCCCCCVASVVSNSVRPHRRRPTRLPSLGFSRQEYWNGLSFPSPVHESETWKWSCSVVGVGCYFLLPCMKVKSESEVAQSCLTLRDPMDCSLPGASVHGIFQARVLESAAIAFFDQLGSLLQMSIMSGETLGRKCITKLGTRQIIHEHRKWPWCVQDKLQKSSVKLYLLLFSRSVMSDPWWPHRL